MTILGKMSVRRENMEKNKRRVGKIHEKGVWQRILRNLE